MNQRPVVVIGAGPAGLATAAELTRRRVPAIVLERSDAVGASWRGRYDRLRLNSSRWFSQLPGMRYPAAPAPSRAATTWCATSRRTRSAGASAYA